MKVRSVAWVAAICAFVTADTLYAQSAGLPQTAEVLAKEPSATYTNAQYFFTLQYPSSLSPQPASGPWSEVSLLAAGPSDGTPVVSIMVADVGHDSAKPYPYPLFFQASVLVGVSRDTAGCYGNSSSSLGPSALEDVKIGGVTFKHISGGDAGMTKYQNGDAYRIIHDNLCYSVEQYEFGSDYRDENTLPGLSDDQLSALYGEAGVIARTFRFTDAVDEEPLLPQGTVALKFAPGMTRIVTDARLDAGETASFTVGAATGQPVMISATGPAGNPTLIVTSLPDGTSLQSAESNRSTYTAVLKSTQDLLLQIPNGDSAEEYTLSVGVPSTVQFPDMTGPTSRSGTAPLGLPVDYDVRATAGQQISLSLLAPNAPASLVVTTLSGGATIYASHPSVGTSSYAFTAPSDGDYIVSVVPTVKSGFFYLITFTRSR